MPCQWDLASLCACGAVVSEVLVIGFAMLPRSEDEGWSLSCAISEVVAHKPDGSPIYASSSSRLIALLAAVALLWIYGGFGFLILQNDGAAPQALKDDEGFLLWGLVLFAPYMANQAKAALTGLGGVGLPFGWQEDKKG